jgi:hypothetical protein
MLGMHLDRAWQKELMEINHVAGNDHFHYSNPGSTWRSADLAVQCWLGLLSFRRSWAGRRGTSYFAPDGSHLEESAGQSSGAQRREEAPAQSSAAQQRQDKGTQERSTTGQAPDGQQSSQDRQQKSSPGRASSAEQQRQERGTTGQAPGAEQPSGQMQRQPAGAHAGEPRNSTVNLDTGACASFPTATVTR